MNTLNDFFNNPFFVIIGGVGTLFSVVALLFTVYLFIKGIAPVLYRLGMGLARRKIAIFAEDEFDDLKDMLVDSGIFRGANIVKIGKTSIKKAEGLSLFLMHWKPFENELQDILNVKRDATALIIYAPYGEGAVPSDIVTKINQHRNSILVNLRGRLLNDILTCMMTTSLKK